MESLPTDKIFIIAEAGSNWKAGTYDEDLERSKGLIQAASKSGADAIKFQTFRANTVYSKNAGTSEYLSQIGINEDIQKIFEHLSMPYEMIPELSELCNKDGILFMSTPFSVEDAKQIDPFVSVHKVASFEINHVRLLEFLAETKKPILISTGASTMTEIKFAIDTCRNNGNNQITLLQCTSKYPAPLESLNLSAIQTLKKEFNLSVGFSDHSVDPILAPILSIPYDPTVIEKHFTLDRNLPGPDHSFAIEPNELTMMVEAIRNCSKAKGEGIKDILKDEMELRQFAKRSLQAIKDIKIGDTLQEGINFDVLRPGNNKRGLDAIFLNYCEGKKVKNKIKEGEGILETDLV